MTPCCSRVKGIPSVGSAVMPGAGSEVARGLRFLSAAEVLSSLTVLRPRTDRLPVVRRRRNELRNERRSDCILVIFPPVSFSTQAEVMIM